MTTTHQRESDVFRVLQVAQSKAKEASEAMFEANGHFSNYRDTVALHALHNAQQLLAESLLALTEAVRDVSTSEARSA